MVVWHAQQFAKRKIVLVASPRKLWETPGRKKKEKERLPVTRSCEIYDL